MRSILKAIVIASCVFPLGASYAAPATNSVQTEQAQTPSPLPVVTYSRALVQSMRDYVQSVSDGKPASKDRVLKDINDVSSTLDDEGVQSARILSQTLKNFDGKIEDMKPVWKAMADFMVQIVRQYKPDVFRQIAQ